MNLYGRDEVNVGNSPTGLAALEGEDEAASDMESDGNLTTVCYVPPRN